MKSEIKGLEGRELNSLRAFEGAQKEIWSVLPPVKRGETTQEKNARVEKYVEIGEKESQLTREFRSWLESEEGLSGHPKAKLLFEIAWEEGHANGFDSVRYYYSAFAELLKPEVE